jgi:hypothetical protein
VGGYPSFAVKVWMKSRISLCLGVRTIYDLLKSETDSKPECSELAEKFGDLGFEKRNLWLYLNILII